MAEKDRKIKEQLDEIKDLKMDLITFEVLRNAFVAACYEASRTIERIAYHPVIGRGRDRSNGILTPDAKLVAHGHTDSAAHYASFEPRVTEVMRFFPKEKMIPGDIYFSSDHCSNESKSVLCEQIFENPLGIFGAYQNIYQVQPKSQSFPSQYFSDSSLYLLNNHYQLSN